MKKQDFNITIFTELRNSIEDGLTRIPIQETFQRKEAISIAKEYLTTYFEGKTNVADQVTESKINNFIQNKLITPKVKEGFSRNTNLYGRNQIRDIILIFILRNYSISYMQIRNMQIAFESPPNHKTSNSSFDVDIPKQGERAYKLLQSRLLAIILSQLCSDYRQFGFHIMIRENTRPTSTEVNSLTSFNKEIIDLKEAEAQVGILRPNDLWAFISPPPDNELLFQSASPNNLAEFSILHWVYISITSKFSGDQYILLIGHKDRNILKTISLPNKKYIEEIIVLLLKGMFITLDDRLFKNEDLLSEVNQSTMLNVLVEIIPFLSKSWEYAILFTPKTDNPSYLTISVMSNDVPQKIKKEYTNIIVEPKQLLPGWAFSLNHTIKVEDSIGEKDPRLLNQNRDSAKAAIAIPIKTAGKNNGVLYVATREKPTDDTEVFSDSEERILRIFSDVIGEIIERNKISRYSEKEMKDILEIEPLSFVSWSTLEDRLSDIIEDIASKNNYQKNYPTTNLLLSIIKIDKLNDVKKFDNRIANWLSDRVLHTTREFYLREGLGNPEIFIKSQTLNDTFVFLFPKINIEDEKDRELRKKLRDLLQSIQQSINMHTEIDFACGVWSMPFRYSTLINRLDTNDKSEIAKTIFDDIESAKEIIFLIEKGHELEAMGAYARAKEIYVRALLHAPNNFYIKRHIAKMCLALNQIEEAAEILNELCDQAPDSSHYCRYAYALAQLGKSKQAYENYAKALKLDNQNWSIFLEWGNLLMVNQKYDDAIEIYEKGLTTSDSKQNLFWLRISNAYMDKGNLPEALRYAKLVLDSNPDHTDAKMVCLKIQMLMRS